MNNNVKQSEKIISPFSIKYSFIKQEIENRLSNLIQLFLKDIQTIFESVNLNQEIKKLNKKLSFQINRNEIIKKENEVLMKENKYLKEQIKAKQKTKASLIPKVDISLKHSNMGSHSHQSHKKYKKVLDKEKQSIIGLHVKRYTLTNLSESNYNDEVVDSETISSKAQKQITINLNNDDENDINNDNEILLKDCCNNYDNILKEEISQLELTEQTIYKILQSKNKI